MHASDNDLTHFAQTDIYGQIWGLFHDFAEQIKSDSLRHMTLSDEQKASITSWVEEGLSLADVQKNLLDQYAISMTYMDVRFLVDDLRLQIKESPRQSEAVERLETAKQQGESERSGAAPGGVSVVVDQITKPQALVSGKVTFSDGETADWMLDRTGRLGLNPSKPNYRPSQEDIMAFQSELQRVAQGFA